MKDFLCLSCCYRWSQRKTTVLKSSGWSFKSWSMGICWGTMGRWRHREEQVSRPADKGKALTIDPQHPTERGLPLVQLSVKIRRSKKELSYVVAFAFWFVICMNHIAWSCRYTRSYEFDGTMIGFFKAERTGFWVKAVQDRLAPWGRRCATDGGLGAVE